MTWLIIKNFLHLDKYLIILTDRYGVFVYLLLFLAVFMETGVVATPFLPGDSLLFAAGAIAASYGTLNVWTLLIIISAAAIAGDSMNYHIGRRFGIRIFNGDNQKFFKKEYLEKTEDFYARHGDKAIVLGRFFPIIRTFVPFVAGIGNMEYRKFLFYNLFGGISWSAIFLLGGYFFGNIEAVKNNFSAVVFGIIILSLLPAFYEIAKKRAKS